MTTPPPVDQDKLPYRIAVLCYLYDEDGCALLLHRRQNPNIGMYSPIGGKLEVESGEGPHSCAIREIKEETGITLPDAMVRLTGIVSETAYQSENHWLIFLFEVMRPIAHDEIARMSFEEGTLEWIAPDDIAELDIPDTDREVIWPLVQEHRNGFFMVHFDCSAQPMRWTLQESMKGEGEGTEARRHEGTKGAV
jgi:8-oxo-dGTP diphosphatase